MIFSCSDRFWHYVCEGGHESVAGWVDPGAFAGLATIAAVQHDAGIVGNVCEIGVHHGRFFIALALLRRPGDRAVAVDVFEQQELNVDGSGRGDRARFQEHIDTAVGSQDDIELVTADSLALRAGDLSRAPGYRMFSIDGGHTVEHTVNDLFLADATVVEGGVAVLDDFTNPAWPGVAEGFHEYYHRAANPRLWPFALGNNKLYLSTEPYCDAYLRAFEDRLQPSATAWKPVVLRGRRAVYARLGDPATALAPLRTA